MYPLPAWRTNYGPLKDPYDTPLPATRDAHKLPTLPAGKLLSFFSHHAGSVRRDSLIKLITVRISKLYSSTVQFSYCAVCTLDDAVPVLVLVP
jgi:hypothetical protein